MTGKRTLHIDTAKIPRSYRDYLDLLRQRGELVDIGDEVDWNLEIGAIIRHATETSAPAPCFSRVRGADGFRACEMGPTPSSAPGRRWQRIALLLGLPEDATLMEIQDAFMEVAFRDPHPPKMVDPAQAPCKENMWFGDDIDLTRLPAPILHDGDGGRYIQTAGAIVVKTPPGVEVPPDHYTYDPNSWTNWSFSRGMIASNLPNQMPKDSISADLLSGWVFEDGVFYAKKQTCGLWLPFQHNGLIYTMWTEDGQDCPFVIALGMPPVAMMQLSAAPPSWHDEYQYASSVLGEGIEMVKAETCDILVPASCEIVIEGRVSKDLTVVEGPFGEFPGYLSSSASLKPLTAVTCITFRDNAVLPICNPGIPIDSTIILGGFSLGITSRRLFEESGLPIVDCFIPFHASSHWLVIRARADWQQATGWTSKEFADRIAEVYWTQHVGKTTAKLFLVDEEISPDDAEAVLWAFIRQSHPAGGTNLYPQYDSDGTGLQIYLSVATKMRGRGGLVLYDCLSKAERRSAPEITIDKTLPVIASAPLFDPQSNSYVVQVCDNWHKLSGLTVGGLMDEIAKMFDQAFDYDCPAKIFVFTEDIPCDDMEKIIWGFATRNNPVQGQYLYQERGRPGVTWQECLENPLLLATKGDMQVGLSIYSGLPIQQEINQPVEQVLSFRTNYPLPLQQKILSKWRDWGFEPEEASKDCVETAD